MFRIATLAAAAAVLGYTGCALAQQPAYSPYTSRYDTNRYEQNSRYAPQNQGGTTTTPGRQDTWAPSQHQGTSYSRQRSTADSGQFSSEGDARARCGSDTVVWVNTKSHVYHFPGSKDYGHTKRGAFMCRADADRAGTYRAARNELEPQGNSERALAPRSGSGLNRY